MFSEMLLFPFSLMKFHSKKYVLYLYIAELISASGTSSIMNLPTNSSVDSEDLSLLVQELRELGFDAIRFASYRTAAKLRFIQKKSNCKS
jgi:hypothetical protein